MTKVQCQELPEADDEFAQLASEFDTIDELRSNIARATDRNGPARAGQPGPRRGARGPDRPDRHRGAGERCCRPRSRPRNEQITSQLGQASLTLEQYLPTPRRTRPRRSSGPTSRSGPPGAEGADHLDKVGDERDIGVDQNDLTQHIMRKAQQDGVPPQQVADHLQEHPHHIEEYMLEIRRGKALALIVESATVTDTDGDPVDLANLRQDGTLGDPRGRSSPRETADDRADAATDEARAGGRRGAGGSARRLSVDHDRCRPGRTRGGHPTRSGSGRPIGPS